MQQEDVAREIERMMGRESVFAKFDAPQLEEKLEIMSNSTY